MFRDKEILQQVLNVKAIVHHVDLAVKEIHHKVFQKHYPKYDEEMNASVDPTIKYIESELKEIKWKMDQILGDDEKVDLSSQLRYLTEAFNSIEGQISGAKDLARKLEVRAEDNAHQYKVTEQMINELKGVVSMARAALVDKKELAAIVNEVKNIAKSVETSYQYRASVTKRLAKLDDIHQWMQEDSVE